MRCRKLATQASQGEVPSPVAGLGSAINLYSHIRLVRGPNQTSLLGTCILHCDVFFTSILIS